MSNICVEQLREKQYKVGKKMNLIDKAILKIIQRRASHWFDLERSLAKIPNHYGATEESP